MLRVDGVEGAEATDVGNMLTLVDEVGFGAPAAPVEEEGRPVVPCE